MNEVGLRKNSNIAGKLGYNFSSVSESGGWNKVYLGGLDEDGSEFSGMNV